MNFFIYLTKFWIHNFMFVSKQSCLFCFLFKFHDIFYGSTTSGTWIRDTKSIFTVFTVLGMINPFVANKRFVGKDPIFVVSWLQTTLALIDNLQLYWLQYVELHYQLLAWSFLELEGQGCGIIMGVTHLLLLGPFYYITL